MSKLLKKEFMIDGNIVELVHKFCGIEVYQYQSVDGENSISYFTKDGVVLAEHEVSADCAQNMGYIADSSWR